MTRRQRAQFRREVVGAAVFLTIITVTAACTIADLSQDARLVGLECEGATGPLYGREESDFPECGSIRPRADF